MNKKYVHSKHHNEVWEVLDESLKIVNHVTYTDIISGIKFYITSEDVVEYIPSKLFLKLYVN
jgi:hypothetical protein